MFDHIYFGEGLVTRVVRAAALFSGYLTKYSRNNILHLEYKQLTKYFMKYEYLFEITFN